MKSARIILWGNLPIKRSAIPESIADLASWPTVDKSALDPNAAESYARQDEAVRLFVEEKGLPLNGIAKRTGVHREQLYRLLERCFRKHPDGRIYGFRGLIPYKHIKEYERRKKVKPSKPRGRGGSAGALQQLLNRAPKTAKWLAKEKKMRERKLKPDEVREIRKSLRSLHRVFLTRLPDEGVTEDEWPFNRDEQGYRSFQAYFYTKSAEDSSSEPDNSVAQEPGRVADKQQVLEDDAPSAMLPFDNVQFDGHKLDIRVTLSFKDQYGLETLVELTRIWILVCLDVVTRAVLGHSIVYSAEYDSDDVARALQACFGPHKGPKFTIPGMAIREGGGFPNGLFEQAQFAGWKWFQYDSARANLAEATLVRLTDIVGCFVKSGRLGEPDDRAFMERFFAVLARHGLHRVAGSTGSSPDDIIRDLADVGSDLRLLIATDEIEQVIEVLLGDYNGESNSGLNGRTPLAAMRHHIAKPGVRFRQLPSPKRRQLIFLQEARLKTVRGKDKPYVNFAGVRYTSDVLSSKPGLFGKTLRIYFNTQDIRQLQAFFEDGSELGILTASRSWRRTPHSLRQRQEIARLCRLGKLNYREGEDAIEAYVAYKRKLAKGNKKAASSLAELAKTAAMAKEVADDAIAAAAAASTRQQPPPASTAEPAEPVASPAGSPPSPAVEQAGRAPTPPVKPKPLSVRRTFTF